ncbi:MAG: hypothetical protein WDM86_04630 [Rhizomicrobium sp.]
MFDTKMLSTATAIGTGLQLTMVIAGHFDPFAADNAFLLGGMGIAAFAGLLCGRGMDGYGGAALAGAVAGGVGALLGIAVSVALGDTQPAILVFGTLSSAVAGAVGGVIARAMMGTRAAAA